MWHGWGVVLQIHHLEADTICSELRERNVVKTLCRVSHQYALFLLQIFEGPHHFAICKAAGTLEEFFCKNACTLLCLEEAKHVFLDLLQPSFFHFSPQFEGTGERLEDYAPNC